MPQLGKSYSSPGAANAQRRGRQTSARCPGEAAFCPYDIRHEQRRLNRRKDLKVKPWHGAAGIFVAFISLFIGAVVGLILGLPFGTILLAADGGGGKDEDIREGDPTEQEM